MNGGAVAGRLSNFMHLSGPSKAIKLLYAPALPKVWVLVMPYDTHLQSLKGTVNVSKTNLKLKIS
jgi:hypothetical protein